MLFSADFINLILYSLQQLGVMLGVGAETIVLVAYILAIRDGAVDSQEERFAKAVKRVLYTGLTLILLSGVAITLMEIGGGHGGIVGMPAYLFKVLLILIVLVLARFTRGSSLPEGIVEGLAGATWYALFVVHILAPIATWGELLVLYVAWVAGFAACWITTVFAMRGGKNSAINLSGLSSLKFQMPKALTHSITPAKPASTPVAYAPTPSPEPEPAAMATAPAPAMAKATETPGLAKVRVMPKSWEELHSQNPNAVRFN